ncbi:MAG: NACHT domain-containing protein [Phormidesmis sp.]
MPMFESAIGGIAWSIVETAGKAGKYVVKQGKEAYQDTQRKQDVLQAFAAYEQHYRNRHCQIKIMPGLMKAPLDLNSIYTDVKLLDDRSIHYFAGVEELEEGFWATGRRGFGPSNAERVKGIEVANREQFLMVLGGPGIGKSTFLRKIGLEALAQTGNIQRECIPVFLELKKFRDESFDIQQEIIKELDVCQFPPIDAWVESALEQGKLLVLFDGLDEVPVSTLNIVIERIEDFVDKHDKNSFVASCRIAAYRSSFRRFVDVTIAEFDNEQIEQFIHRWFDSREDEELGIAEKYLELLNQKEHEATKELAQTPLLLTFLCLLYDRKQMLPSKRSVLYGRALDIILDEWSAQKRIERNPIHERLNPELEKILLAQIAYESFSQNQLFFSKETITDRIAEFLADTVENPKYLNASDVLQEIEVQQGILVERATDAYSFSHLTLQEYLTASYIVDNQLEKTLVEEYLTDESWREVFLLASGLMGNRAFQLLLAMEEQAKAYVEPYEKVKALVKWAAVNKVGESTLEQRAGMIAIAAEIGIGIGLNSAMFIFLHSNSIIDTAVASAIATASAMDVAIDIDYAADSGIGNAIVYELTGNIDIAISNAKEVTVNGKHHIFDSRSMEIVAKELLIHTQAVPEPCASPDLFHRWIMQLRYIWLETLELDEDAITFSSMEVRALKDYLHATELLIRCKESAIRVSRSEWAAMEKRLLTIQEN